MLLGRKKYQRFDVIRGHGCAIYVVELANGWMKVGFSRGPCNRMKSLSAQLRREFSTEIVRFHISAAMPLRTTTKAEALLIREMNSVAKPATQCRKELFHSISFEAAKTIVDKVCEAHLQAPP